MDVDGVEGWVVAGDVEVPDTPAGGVHCCRTSMRTWSAAAGVGLPGPAARRALAGSQAGNFPVLLVDGVVAGVWRQRPASGCTSRWSLRPLSTREREVAAEADRIAALLGGTAGLTIGAVTVGAHA